MDLETKAIERIKLASEQSLFHYKKPLIVTYSGGKDSDVLLELFKRSGVPFIVSNSHTTVDAPQTVYHIREVFKQLELQGIKCEIDYHRHPDGTYDTMWNLIPRKKLPPTRAVRWCCGILKEQSHPNSFIATGVRWDESVKRKNTRSEFEKLGSTVRQVEGFNTKMLLENNEASRRMTELCMQQNKMVVNPIIDWKNSDIWQYIRSEKIRTNPLYECGYDRVGCIGCPMAGKHRWKEFADFPKYQDAYIRAFDKMIQNRPNHHMWTSGIQVFKWWMEDDNVDGQLSFDMQGNIVEDYK